MDREAEVAMGNPLLNLEAAQGVCERFAPDRVPQALPQVRRGFFSTLRAHALALQTFHCMKGLKTRGPVPQEVAIILL
jgi:hypothetical protein